MNAIPAKTQGQPLSLSPANDRDRILVVDDSTDNLFLLQATLEDQGYEIDLAADGKTALEKVDASPPHLILLDVMMPEMDGYEVTQRIRQNDKLPFIPILLITAYEQSDVVAGLDAGADDFIRKPVDIDEVLARVRSLLRLKHTIDDRERLLRQQEDFVSRLTHDLRTPLVAADRMMRLFKQNTFGPTTPEMREALSAMLRSNQNLLQMVNTLLEVYRHDSGYKSFNFMPCNLQEITQAVVQELTALAEEKGLQLVADFSGQPGDGSAENDHSYQLIGDQLELQRVVTNLIGNALKFTDEGTIAVRLSQQPADGKNWISLEVQDTGWGISPEDQTSVFERYRQGTHKRAGSGLGLYLSNQIIQAHGGHLSVCSAVGEGSLFKVRLPAIIIPAT